MKRERSGKGAYIYAASLDAVVSAIQNGAVELHTWGATVPDIKHPDRITMDLDPDEALPWKLLVEGTLLTKTLLDGLGLKSFLETTGPDLFTANPCQGPPAEQDFRRLPAQFGNRERHSGVRAACAAGRRRIGAARLGRARPEGRPPRAVQRAECPEAARPVEGPLGRLLADTPGRHREDEAGARPDLRGNSCGRSVGAK